MIKRDVVFAVFINYDNLLQIQKNAGVLDVVTKVLIQIILSGAVLHAKCDVRIYGEWYEGTQISRMAQDVASEISRDFPTIIRLPTAADGFVSVSANAELAVALLQEPGHHLFNTYRRKGKPANVRVEEPTTIGCTDPACILPLMKKFIKTGNCPKPGCSVGVGNLITGMNKKLSIHAIM